jgi:hypothetical protein
MTIFAEKIREMYFPRLFPVKKNLLVFFWPQRTIHPFDYSFVGGFHIFARPTPSASTHRTDRHNEGMDEERKPNGEDRMDTEDATPAAANGAEEKQGEGEAQTSTATPVKIGFSFGGLAAGKRKVSIQGTKKEEGEEGRELVTAIQGSKMKTLFEKDDGPLVIPLPQPLRSKKAKIEGTIHPKIYNFMRFVIYLFLSRFYFLLPSFSCI